MRDRLTELPDEGGPAPIAGHLPIVGEKFYLHATLRACLYDNRGFSYIRWPKTSIKHLYRSARFIATYLALGEGLHKTFGTNCSTAEVQFDRIFSESKRNKQATGTTNALVVDSYVNHRKTDKLFMRTRRREDVE